MIALFEWLGGQGTAFWQDAFAVFLRVGAVVMLFPGFGEQVVPVRFRLSIAVAFTLVVLPVVAERHDLSEIPTLQLVATETFTGLLFGAGLRLMAIALQAAGAIAAQASSLSQLLGGAATEPMPAVGHVFFWGGLALAFATGLHVKAAQYMVLTYDLIAPGAFPSGEMVSSWGLQQVSASFSLAFRLAAPFVLASAVYYLALGAINRAMPQLMVAFVGAPLITGGALVILCFVTPAILTLWLGALDGLLFNPAEPTR
ncbi:flagellar biosynthetic protein FliR [Shimia biformata]|uniref:flagellar biosynthetic protein FliR n=1 Tax=Shimia biformata TaxID=1294299 RepID=UPI00194FA0F6|nr:flagellar biosynthetic protein FliR [Shimia biformata]